MTRPTETRLLNELTTPEEPAALDGDEGLEAPRGGYFSTIDLRENGRGMFPHRR